MLPPHLININSVQSICGVIGAIATLIGALNRHRIARHVRHLFSSFKKTAHLVTEVETLTERLASAEERNVEWAAAFENVDNLRLAISEQLERLKIEIDEIRKRLSAKDELNHLLQSDRDALLTWGRLLVGQMHASKILPDYPAPPLRSVVAVPVPETFDQYLGVHDKPIPRETP